ncbi:P-loop containing nucleoside triphosphate hydrolase protein [Hygrophoropsis aurantiaca]|uniref:P-loop containing nucleoside triphosphate hydrolase protein n=1 Tax=Hygrophoropsis aurantiaca TaxID=72124 RepID=A0ACB8AUE0_9AGAM|nr:P-loop containing nucleoside triphosphate hydrolase protein [Hygrophoropsis aurantiaca]
MKSFGSEADLQLIPNVVIFGETGVGKSSLVNLIAGKKLTKTSSSATGCTLDAKQHIVEINQHKFRLYDTVGLNEPSLGENGYLIAVEKAFKLIKELESSGGIRLLLFCMRGGRITAAAQYNYRLFFEILCDKKVPIALVITNLENEISMDGWWHTNHKQFEKFGMKSVGHACVVADPGLDRIHQVKYDESRAKMHALILSQTDHSSWKAERGNWFVRVAGMLRNWVFESSPSTSIPDLTAISHKLVHRCGFGPDEAAFIANKIVSSRNDSYTSLVSSSTH